MKASPFSEAQRAFILKQGADGMPMVDGMDFVHEQRGTGRKVRVRTVGDSFSRLSPVVDPHFS